MIKKKEFVKTFEVTLRIANPEMSGLRYYAYEENGEEFVDICYKNGLIKPVCITADSFNAIIKDIMRKMN